VSRGSHTTKTVLAQVTELQSVLGSSRLPSVTVAKIGDARPCGLDSGQLEFGS
jgi:hypothetical protein